MNKFINSVNRKNSNNRSEKSYLVFTIILGLISFLILQLPLFNNINNLFIDPLLGEVEARDQIVIVGIDDKSLSEIGSWPWDRKFFSDTIENIFEQKPAVVGVDVLFLESRSGDQEFVDTIEENQVPVVLGSKIVDSEILHSIFNEKKNVYPGFVNFSPDLDGKIRNTKVFENSSLKCEISFGLSLASQYFGLDSENLCSNPLRLRSHTYSLSSNNEIQFSYTKEEFTTISFSDVFNNKFSEGFFKDKIVLIGSTALDLRSGLNDNFTSIFGDAIPGVEIHANILNSFLQNTFFNKTSVLYNFVNFLLLVIIFCFLTLKSKRAAWDLSIMIGLQLANLIWTLILVNFGFIFPFVQFAILIFVIYVFGLVYKYFTKNKESQYIKAIFSRYLNKDLLNVLLQSPEKLKLGGETKNMTVLFSDVRSFTSISESLLPEELVSMLNDYLSYMTEIVLKNKGTVDKYIGDAIMAFWNAPLDDENHLGNALKTALEMTDKIREFNKLHPEYPELKVGIGINSGNMTVGNIGGQDRFDYTVLGDNVNLGSRLEGLTKKYGVTIIVSEVIAKDTKLESVIFRELDEVKVKGRENTVKIYEPLVKNEENAEIKSKYEEALRYYQKGKFKEASSILEKNLDDKPSEILLGKVKDLISNPPKSWDGITRYDEK